MGSIELIVKMAPAEMQLNECSGSSVNVTDDREAHPGYRVGFE